ncbi:MAG: hypothetical protein M1282_08930 [Chloroflexi bacterium]|nr:hypothetical protein [Chloroflexota bacterium]
MMALKKDMHADWLSCAFQWYAVSIYNYIRLAGWLATKDTDFTNEYVNRVIPKITEYRHKVAAHFAITAPRNDNEADLRASIITNIVYAHGFLRAGALSEILIDENGKDVETKNKTSWSLTKTHQILCQRYWPNGLLDAFESFKISAGATRNFRINWED